MKKRGLRKIKDGKVKFFGKYYTPKDDYYGELDGQWWFFIGYQPSEDMLAMWGDRQRYLASMDDKTYELDCDRTEKNVMSDGKIFWYFWVPVIDE